MDLASRFQAVRTVIEDVVSQTQMAMSAASELGQEAAAHGWEGVALVVQAAYGDLEAAFSDLHSALDAADRAAIGAAGVREVVGAQEIAQQLAVVVDQADDVWAVLDAAAASVKEAYGWAQQAEAARLAELVSDLAQSIDAAQKSVVDVKDVAETERQEAVAWGEGGQRSARSASPPSAPTPNYRNPKHAIVHPRVPKYVEDEKCQGVLSFGGEEVPLESGESGPGRWIRDNFPGGPGSGKTFEWKHVEGHAASVRQRDIKRAEPYVNLEPCGPGGPSQMPGGSEQVDTA